MSELPKLHVVEVVTREHGERFAAVWHDRSVATGAMVEALAKTDVMKWPDSRPLQMHFHDIEDEIMERVFDEVRDAVADAFVRIAGEVLARERARTPSDE